jgi:hypothetical protein
MNDDFAPQAGAGSGQMQSSMFSNTALSGGLRRAPSPETLISSLSTAKEDMFNPNFLLSSSARAGPTVDELMRASVADSKYFSAPSNAGEFDDLASDGTGSRYVKQSRYQAGAQVGMERSTAKVSVQSGANYNGLRDSNDSLGVLGSSIRVGSVGHSLETSSNNQAPVANSNTGAYSSSSVLSNGNNSTATAPILTAGKGAVSAAPAASGSTDSSTKPVGRFGRLASFGLGSLFGGNKRR